MKLMVNGEEKNFANVSNLRELVKELKLEGKPVAIELNKQVVTKNNFDSTSIKDGDKLEVVTFIGGG